MLWRWRSGQIERGDRAGWEHGWLLDYLDRHGDVPRQVDGNGRDVPTALVLRHGGPNTVIGSLHLCYADVAAAAVLLLCLTGQNLRRSTPRRRTTTARTRMPAVPRPR